MLAAEREKKDKERLWEASLLVCVGDDEDERRDEVNDQLTNELEALALYRQLSAWAAGNLALYPAAWLLTVYGDKYFPRLFYPDLVVVMFGALDLNAKVLFSTVVMRARDRVDRLGLPSADWRGDAAARPSWLRQWHCFQLCNLGAPELAGERPAAPPAAPPPEYGAVAPLRGSLTEEVPRPERLAVRK